MGNYIIIAGLQPGKFAEKGGANYCPGVRIERRGWGYYMYLQSWVPLNRGIQILKRYLVRNQISS